MSESVDNFPFKKIARVKTPEVQADATRCSRFHRFDLVVCCFGNRVKDIRRARGASQQGSV